MTYATSATKNEMTSDGLRYKSKATGSQYGTSHAMGTISCLRCGHHRARSLLKKIELAGRHQHVCAQDCRPSAQDR